MKRTSVVLLVVLIAVALVFSACAKKENKVLKVGTNAEYPPFEFKEGTEYTGVDMDLAKAIAEKMGLKLEIIDMEFDSLIPSLASNKIDMAISAITITEDRKGQVDFSEPYYMANQVIIAKPDSKEKIAKLEDLAKFKVGAQNGTTGQLYLDSLLIKTKLMKEANLKKYSTNIEAITDMLNGNIDFVIIDNSAAEGYAKKKPLKTVFSIETNESYGIAFPKESPYLSQVNTILAEMKKSGAFTDILAKYFGEEKAAPADTTNAK